MKEFISANMDEQDILLDDSKILPENDSGDEIKLS